MASTLKPSGTSYDLGGTSDRWNGVYASTINTSGAATIGGNLTVSGSVKPNATDLNLGGTGTNERWNKVYVSTIDATGEATVGSLHVEKSANSIYCTGVDVSATNSFSSYNQSNEAVGVRAYATGGTGNLSVAYGVQGTAEGTKGTAYGVYGKTTSTGSTAYGVFASASGAAQTNYGIYAEANSATGENYAGYFNGPLKAVYAYSGNTAYFENTNGSDFGVALKAKSNGGWAGYFEGPIHCDSYLDIDDNLSVDGNLNVYGRIYGTVNGSSDSRLKKDVQTIDGALGKVLKLRGVSYYWKNKSEMGADSAYAHNDTKKHIGVIAQEIEQEFPELVHTDGNGYKSVEYSAIAPILIEAVKELKAEKDALQAEKDALEAKVEKLEAQMQEILEKLK